MMAPSPNDFSIWSKVVFSSGCPANNSLTGSAAFFLLPFFVLAAAVLFLAMLGFFFSAIAVTIVLGFLYGKCLGSLQACIHLRY